MPDLMKYIHKKYSVPYWALLITALIGAILAFISAPVPSIYGLIEDAVVAGYIGFSVNPVALVVSRRQGATKFRIPGGPIIAPIAFISASLIIFWSGWITVYYAVAILTVAVVIFGLILPVYRNSARRDLKHVRNSIWYIFYIVFLLIMTYIGSDGMLNLISFYDATAIVVVVSVLVFYPAGVFSGLKSTLVDEAYQTAIMEPEEPIVLQ